MVKRLQEILESKTKMENDIKELRELKVEMELDKSIEAECSTMKIAGLEEVVRALNEKVREKDDAKMEISTKLVVHYYSTIGSHRGSNTFSFNALATSSNPAIFIVDIDLPARRVKI